MCYKSQQSKLGTGYEEALVFPAAAQVYVEK